MKPRHCQVLVFALFVGACAAPQPALEVPTPGVVVCYLDCERPEPTRFDVPARVQNLPAVSRAFGEAAAERLGNAAVGINEVAHVFVLVGADGRAREVRLAETTTYRQTNELAVDVATALRFDPAMLNGSPIEVWVPVALPIQRRLPRDRRRHGTVGD